MSPSALRVVAPLGGLTAGLAAAFAWSACTSGHDFGGSLALSFAGGALATLLGAGVGAATSALAPHGRHVRTSLACGAIAVAFYVALLRWPSTWVAMGALGAGPWTALPLAVLPLVGAIAGACSASLGERQLPS